MQKRFLYLVLAESGLPPQYSSIESEDSDVLVATWKEKAAGCVFNEDNTWTKGRNLLLRTALERPPYLYYIFLDDDLVLKRGCWRTFEASLLKYLPAIGSPAYNLRVRPSHVDLNNVDVCGCRSYDAACNAFHREVIEDALVLPYYDGQDDVSWWLSQVAMFHIAFFAYPHSCCFLPATDVHNSKSRPYPRPAQRQMEEMFSRFEDWLLNEVIAPEATQRFRRHWVSRREVIPFMPKVAPYRTTEEERRILFRWDAPFWERHRALAKELRL